MEASTCLPSPTHQLHVNDLNAADKPIVIHNPEDSLLEYEEIMWERLALGLNSTLSLIGRKPGFTFSVCHKREKRTQYLGLQ